MRKKAIPITDERVKLMSEIITAIKLVKMYAWEKSFAKKINGKYNSPQLYYSITHLSHLVHCGPGLVLVQVWRWSCRVPSSTSSKHLLSVSLYHLITSYLAFLAFSFPEPSSQPPFLYISLFLSFGQGHTTEVDTFPCSQLLCSHSLHDFPYIINVVQHPYLSCINPIFLFLCQWTDLIAIRQCQRDCCLLQ